MSIGTGISNATQTTRANDFELAILERLPSQEPSSGMTAVLFCNGGKPDLLEICTFDDELWDGLYDGFAIDAAT